MRTFLPVQLLVILAKMSPFQDIQTRALPDIMSGPEVRQIFKVRTVRNRKFSLPDAGLITL